MRLQQGESAGRLDVLSVLDPVLRLAHRISKEEEMQAEEGKRVGMEAGDGGLKFGLWLVCVRKCQEKASREREGNPNPVRESGSMYLEDL